MTVAPGSVLLVTGASGGIGFEIAAQAAEAGAVVGVHGSRGATVEAAVTRLRERVPAGRFIALPADFREPGAIELVIAQLTAETGGLDALVHCAITGAPGITGAFRDTDPDNFGAAMQNMIGIFQRLCFAALPHLSERGGTIIAFASDNGRFAAPRQSIIGAAYGGIMAFVRNLAVEVGRDGVRVHCLSPSYVMNTPVFDRFAATSDRAIRANQRAPLGLPTPQDIAPIALFLCGPGATKITGQVISINGGLHA
ncbi:MAG TPA: SDR family oxidoreductase [Sphingobium sp.]|nr:SDR family oxidoreductase [Sphingobium sp.]